jgi:hypothetical protein
VPLLLHADPVQAGILERGRRLASECLREVEILYRERRPRGTLADG